jgi:hypothetical protein
MDPRTLFCVLAVALVFVKHRANIGRLLRGTESKIRWGEPVRKSLHVLALGLWFGSAVFFTFVATPSLFVTLTELGKQKDRPDWFPLPQSYARTDDAIQGPMEQGGRAFGYAVGPLFHSYFLLQGLCGVITAWTALAWCRENPGVKIHKWRAAFLLLALVTVLVGWPLERKVAELRDPRNQSIDAYLLGDTSTATLEKMHACRDEFGHWHFFSLMLNFATVILVTGGMALASQLPAGPKSELS